MHFLKLSMNFILIFIFIAPNATTRAPRPARLSVIVGVSVRGAAAGGRSRPTHCVGRGGKAAGAAEGGRRKTGLIQDGNA